MNSSKMTSLERRAVISLSLVTALRMIGLFMVLPVFSIYAKQLPGATPALIGLALGIYGLSQAIFQIPFGTLSDHIGRKPVIITGLTIFVLGSFIAGTAHSIAFMILGRALQGIGAVGSTIMALMADLTRDEQRTKAMAISGITIGFSFIIAILLGPLLTQWMSFNHLFFLAMGFGLCAIVILLSTVPTPKRLHWQRDSTPELKSFLTLLSHPELAKLNCGIFILHALFTASFVVIPISLNHFMGLTANRQWTIYLPTLLIALIISLFCMGFAERKQQIKPYFLSGIAALALAELFFWLAPQQTIFTVIGLCLFFGGFNLLEAFLPSLISRAAPAARKGSALGIYSCAQFFGIFVGGIIGGWLFGQFNFSGVYLFCVTLALLWLVLAVFMQTPRYLVTQVWQLSSLPQDHWEAVKAKLQVIPGMVEVTIIAEDALAYLKMERRTAQHPEFIRLKENTIGTN